MQNQLGGHILKAVCRLFIQCIISGQYGDEIWFLNGSFDRLLYIYIYTTEQKQDRISWKEYFI